jgi:hypothetical protein
MAVITHISGTGWLLLLLLLRSLLLLSNVRGAVASAVPIKVFILAGQSNMVGHGSMDHLDQLMRQNTSSEYRTALWNGTHYIIRNDVYVKFGARHGFLTVSRTAGWAASQAFGPEALCGITLGNAAGGHPEATAPPAILLLKTAYGGRSLAVDFRPPSAGIGNYSDITDPSFYGWQYRAMMNEIQESLHNLTSYFPNYNPTMGYKLNGFIWLQGWNDVIDWAKVREYESNLVHFISDVRRDLNAPNLPFGT